MTKKSAKGQLTPVDSLRYADEADRALGATGMAIAVVVLDGDELINAVDLDAEPDEMIDLAPDFYFEGNPSLMASASWRKLVSHFNLTAGMLLGNVLCRRLVGARCMPSEDERTYLLRIVTDEGVETCSLEPEEAANLFNNNYHRMLRVFSHRGVHSLALDFASLLRERRTLSRLELLSALSALRMI